MNKDEQSDSQCTPWNHDQTEHRNIILEFQKGKNHGKNRYELNDRQSKMNTSFSRYFQKRRINKAQIQKRKYEEMTQKTFYADQKLQITNIEPQQKNILNQTIQVNEIFPSYSFKRVQKDLTFYKPHRYHPPHKTQQRQGTSNQQKKYSLNISKKEYKNDFTRNITSKKLLQFSLFKKNRIRDNKSNNHFKAVNLPQSNQYLIAIKKSGKRSEKFQDILLSVQRKQKQKHPSLGKKNIEPIQINKCLKSKKQFFLNLPKIQFIQIYQ